MDKNSSFLVAPDCLLLLWMALVLYGFHRKRNLGYLQLWSKGLLLIVVEDIARMFYLAPTSPLIHKITHVCALVTYYFAGLAFFWTASGNLRLAPHCRRYLAICSVPHLLLLTTYGMEMRHRLLFIGLAAGGWATSTLAALVLRYPRVHLLCHAAFWLPSIYLAYGGHFRSVTYYSLFGIYAATALGFYRTLPHKRRGRTIVIAGFATWAICFLTHPLFRDVLQYWNPLASRIWDLERFVITLGLLCLALEELSATHEFDALHDALTSLPNRRLFADRLQQALARARRNCSRVLLVNIDLNSFKCVNDQWGHPAGDFMLCEITSRLRAVTRESDTLCRVGGDEFCLLIEDFAPSQELAALSFQKHSQNLIEKIRQRVEAAPLLCPTGSSQGQIPLHASLSIGLASFPDEAANEEDLIRVADQRMYQDKKERKRLRTGSETCG